MIPRPGVPNGDITGPNGQGLVFRTGTLQARTAEAWCSGRGYYRPERPNPGAGRGHYRTERPRPGVPNGDITGPNGRTLVFPEGDITGQNGRGLVLPDGDITGQNGRGLVLKGREHYRPERPRPGIPGRGHYRPRFPARLPTGWHSRLLMLLSNTPQIMWCCSGSPVLLFAVVAFVVCRRRRVIFLRGAVYDGRKGQAF